MFLKGVSLQGFKSFADKVNLHFGSGISVIVGPNGSGKSNIADGVRWVLGEQSAKSLRGAKMEDVIFSGSAKRRSIGMAEISLTLDNASGYFSSQYSEITITRRLYRSGESEYLINKRPCRLKDVHELFMDTGLGKEAFSIIGQGKVEEILNSKSEERRFLIEEVAGIIKYKNRKKEAAKKLEETEQHLQRIIDLISELDNQLVPLEQQAAKAKVYKQVKEELESLEIAVLTGEILKATALVAEISQNVDSLTVEKTGMETEIAQSNNNLEILKVELNLQREKLAQVQQKIYDLKIAIEKLEGNINHSQQLLCEYAQQEEGMADEINNIKIKVDDTFEKLTQTIAQVTQLQTEEQEKRAHFKLSEEQGEVTKEKLNKLMHFKEELKSSLFEVANDKTRQKNIISNSENEFKKVEAVKEKKLLELEKLHFQQASLENKSAEIIAKQENLNKVLEMLYSEKNIFNEELQKSLIKQSNLQHELKEAELKLEQFLSRLTVLKEMQNNYEGYQTGVKAILGKWRKNPDRFPGVVGVVGELVQVEEKYITAIETALGGAMQNIVTTTVNGAKLAIAYLKDNKAGRCTFLPIESMKAYPKLQLGEVANMPNVCGIASELINYNSNLNQVIGNLLNRTIVVEDINTATAIAKKFNYKVKVVTLSGEVISPGGAITGGLSKFKNNGLLSRNVEIEKLEKIVIEGKNTLSKQTNLLHELHICINDYESKLKEINEAIQAKKLVKVEYDKDQDQVNLEMIRSRSWKDTLIKEINIINEEVKIVMEEKEKAGENILIIERKEEKIQLELMEVDKKLTQTKSEIENESNSLTEEKLALAGLSKEIGYLENETIKLREVHNSERDRLNKKIEDNNTLELKIKSLKEAQVKDQALLTEKVLEKKKEDERYLNITNETRGLEEKINQLEDETKIAAKNLTDVREKIHLLELKLARAESEKKGHIEKLAENYDYDFEENSQIPQLHISKKEAKEKILEAKRKIGSMGEVNLGAIEEYARLSERNLFLKSQYDDLEKARGELIKVINEMEALMEERFGKAFNLLSQQFSQVFRDLFGGGSAELILTDEENLMETGIDIVAQPPGKKPQQLSLLSGGERALTAIALLFAVLKVKPSPFCVLDEIEASLDEANVHRFAAFLKEFSEKTQFIVISHRKGTMEIADVLYGVTMEESGVSKLISVKLTEAAS